MKSCPTCKRTYPDDTLAFCLVDGAILSAPFDPQETRRIPPTRDTTPPATEVLPGSSVRASAPREQSTIRAPQPQLPSMYDDKQTDNHSPAKRSMAPWLIVGGAVLLVAAFAVVMLASKWPAPSPSGNQNVMAKSTPGTQTRSACGRVLSPLLYDKWMEMGGESGRFGCPIADESQAPGSPQGTTGRWVQFAKGDGGYLIWHQSGPNSGKTVEVSGCMFKLYASKGGTNSWLGFPISDGRETTSGARQDFEGGYVLWDSKTYVCQGHKN